MFPVFEELLKPQVYNRDPQGMEEARLRASTMLCKTFLQYTMRVDEQKAAIPALFLKVLDLLERFMLNSRRDQLVSVAQRVGLQGGTTDPESSHQYEAVPESLKNVVLVMHSSEILKPPPATGATDERTDTQQALWSTAHDRIERFLPGFMGQVLPQPAAPAPPALVPSVAAKATAADMPAKT